MSCYKKLISDSVVWFRELLLPNRNWFSITAPHRVFRSSYTTAIHTHLHFLKIIRVYILIYLRLMLRNVPFSSSHHLRSSSSFLSLSWINKTKILCPEDLPVLKTLKLWIYITKRWPWRLLPKNATSTSEWKIQRSNNYTFLNVISVYVCFYLE